MVNRNTHKHIAGRALHHWHGISPRARYVLIGSAAFLVLLVNVNGYSQTRAASNRLSILLTQIENSRKVITHDFCVTNNQQNAAVRHIGRFIGQEVIIGFYKKYQPSGLGAARSQARGIQRFTLLGYDCNALSRQIDLEIRQLAVVRQKTKLSP